MAPSRVGGHKVQRIARRNVLERMLQCLAVNLDDAIAGALGSVLSQPGRCQLKTVRIDCSERVGDRVTARDSELELHETRGNSSLRFPIFACRCIPCRRKRCKKLQSPSFLTGHGAWRCRIWGPASVLFLAGTLHRRLQCRAKLAKWRSA